MKIVKKLWEVAVWHWKHDNPKFFACCMLVLIVIGAFFSIRYS
jgi:hypothetical protein